MSVSAKPSQVHGAAKPGGCRQISSPERPRSEEHRQRHDARRQGAVSLVVTREVCGTHLGKERVVDDLDEPDQATRDSR